MTIGDGHDLKSSRFAGDEVLEACYDNERVLRRGDSGPAVEKIQQALIFLGFPVPKVGASGIFGDETELAVRSYQEARGLKVDGIAGPDTIGNLDSEFYTGPTEHRVTPAPEPQVSKVKTPLEPESPVRPAHASPLGPVRAPEVPRVRAPEVPRVRAPPVPVPETPELATKVTQAQPTVSCVPTRNSTYDFTTSSRPIVRGAYSFPKGHGKGIGISKSRLGNQYILK